LDGLAPVPPVEQRAPGQWQIGTVAAIKPETPRIKSFLIELPMWMPHLPGQHYDVRLTAPDGYHAQRSYSVASSPLDEREIELTIDRLEDGEVSPYFHDVVVEGDQVEVRGPFTSYFVWRGEAPVLLVGGGSGVVHLMAMLRHRRPGERRRPAASSTDNTVMGPPRIGQQIPALPYKAHGIRATACPASPSVCLAS
jgi:ferredoxin-NADP reductase